MASNDGTEVAESTPLLQGTAGARRYDVLDIDARFKRWMDHVTGRKAKQTPVSPLERDVQFVVTVFEKTADDIAFSKQAGPSRWPSSDGHMVDEIFRLQLDDVRTSITDGLHPKMIQTGSSGSYFVRSYAFDRSAAGKVRRLDADADTVAVFKPHDEEPYGDLNPKRVLLRRYLWWAMGRPCLIASFSYLSEVGASLLDDRLKLGIVPTTKLVSLSSKSFFYSEKARRKAVYPEKQGSYQKFLQGYVNASSFLRSHPWPSRPRDLLERDLEAENAAHGRLKARKRKGRPVKMQSTSGSAVRSCLSVLSPVNCLAPLGLGNLSITLPTDRRAPTPMGEEAGQASFEWTPELMQDFRLELERLVCFDFLIRNTDRGLDNFMVKVTEADPKQSGSRRRLKLCAIDNSLAFPWTHPAGIRSYPFGWLYLPTDLIGGPFSTQTRAAFLSCLSDPAWWQETQADLEALFRQDQHFDVKKFEGQMEVLRGQGWNLLESLRDEDEGPLELCARQKRLVTRRTEIIEVQNLPEKEGFPHPLTAEARSIKAHTLSLAIQKSPTAAVDIGKTTSPARSELAVAGKTSTPQSLPHDSDLEQFNGGTNNGVDRMVQSTHLPLADGPQSMTQDDTLGRAYRQGSLGIDVLHEIDRSTRRPFRRPTLRKAFTRGQSVSRVPQVQEPSGRPRTSTLSGVVGESEPRTAPRDGESRTAAVAEEEQLLLSVASLDSDVYERRPARPVHSRRRIGSVSDSRNIVGVLNLPEDRATSLPQQKMKVIVESLQIDDGIAWQTWLGLS